MQPVIRLAEAVAIVDMVPERRQRLRVVPSRGLSSPVERTLQGTPALSPDPGLLAVFPLASSLPSTASAASACARLLIVVRPSTSFGRFIGTLELSDSLPPCITAVPRGFAARAWGR